MKYYIKERINPQLDKPYYAMQGKLSIKEAKKRENPDYGSNNMIPFDNEQKYLQYGEKLKADGFRVYEY